MKFAFTPEEARPIAKNVAKYYKSIRYNISEEAKITNDAPLLTTLILKKANTFILVEAQSTLIYSPPIQKLAHFLSQKRINARFFIAIPQESSISAHDFKQMKTDGVGLFIVSADENPHELQIAKNFALQINVAPELSFGYQKREILSYVEKFNGGERKGGLQDICEKGEELTRKLAEKVSNKKWIKPKRQNIDGADWCSLINILASNEQYKRGKKPIFDQVLKADLHSFRNARNLVDHAARNPGEKKRLQRQFTDKMYLGIRLVSELLALLRKLR